MTEMNEAVKSSVPQWTEEELKKIANLQETLGCSRPKAIRKMQAGVKVSTVKPAEKKAVKHAPKPKAEKKPKRESTLPEKSKTQVKRNQEELDNCIRKALREGYGHPCPVLGVLGSRFAEPSKTAGYPFYRVLADAGKDGGLVAVFVSGFYKGSDGIKASITPAVRSSYTVSRLLKSIEKRTKRVAAKLAKDEAKSKAKSK
jgi:hypothetical protein